MLAWLENVPLCPTCLETVMSSVRSLRIPRVSVFFCVAAAGERTPLSNSQLRIPSPVKMGAGHRSLERLFVRHPDHIFSFPSKEGVAWWCLGQISSFLGLRILMTFLYNVLTFAISTGICLGISGPSLTGFPGSKFTDVDCTWLFESPQLLGVADM